MSRAYTLETAYTIANNLLQAQYSNLGEEAVPTIISVYQTGSRYVGFNTEASDYDFTLLCLPSKRMIYQGEKVSGRKTTEVAEGETLELTFVDVRTYLNQLTNSDLHSIQLLFAKAEQVYHVPFRLHNSLMAEDVQDYFHELAKDRDNLYLLNPLRYFDSLVGQMLAHKKQAERSLAEQDWGKVVKHGIHVEYLTELLHGVFNYEPLFPLLTYSQLVRENLVRSRETANEYTANLALKVLTQNIEVFLGENKYKAEFRFRNEAYRSLNELKADELKDTLCAIMLGGYGE